MTRGSYSGGRSGFAGGVADSLGWLLLATSLSCSKAPLSKPDASEPFPGGAGTNTLLFGSKAFTAPAANASKESEMLFFSGNSFFNSAWVEAPSSTRARDGLGPLFNARSCSGCHFNDGRGAPPLEEDEAFLGVLFRIGNGKLDARGAPAPDPTYGDQIQPEGLPDVPGEATPRVTYSVIAGTYDDGQPYELLKPTYSFTEPAYGPLSADLRVSPRAAPMMIGLGLLEAISEEDLSALADPDDADGDGISGKLNRVWDESAGEHRPGRFGWKAEQPSVRQQVAGAFFGDMGLTTPIFSGIPCTEAEEACLSEPSGGEPEVDEETFERVVVYSELLAVPERAHPNDKNVLLGRQTFRDIGCADCHVPTHTTGESRLKELENQKIWPYTDLLLHDMGEGLSDDRPSFEAEGAEWRTAPLWGIGRIEDVNGHNRLLHDGRARGVPEAILWHGGEAETSRDAFKALSRSERDNLVKFVLSL
jgi:CxxC motif-containing protein (DUF1111 family)